VRFNGFGLAALRRALAWTRDRLKDADYIYNPHLDKFGRSSCLRAGRKCLDEKSTGERCTVAPVLHPDRLVGGWPLGQSYLSPTLVSHRSTNNSTEASCRRTHHISGVVILDRTPGGPAWLPPTSSIVVVDAVTTAAKIASCLKATTSPPPSVSAAWAYKMRRRQFLIIVHKRRAAFASLCKWVCGQNATRTKCHKRVITE